MENYDVYQDLAKRTDGDIYLGVVGPVRTGKSTFVKRFAELFVLPNVAGKNKQRIAADELPQSGAGKTVTTTEPKFIPGEAVRVTLKGKTTAKMRLIDCVGFMVDGALGAEENGEKRMVTTPWNKDPIPFEDAAGIGTEKVITEHSTIGLAITCDGSIADIPRDNYVKAEEHTIERLKSIGKPFAIVLNSKEPNGKNCRALRASLEEKYGVGVVAMDVLNADETEYAAALEKVLTEFPLNEIDVSVPDWLNALPPDNAVVKSIIDTLRSASQGASKMKDENLVVAALAGLDRVVPESEKTDAGEGTAEINLALDKSLFYEAISETCGEKIDGDCRLMGFVAELTDAKREYDKLKNALAEAEANGYGIVLPGEREVKIDKPRLEKRGRGYCVKIDAETESLHVVKIGVKADVTPISGSKKQCEEFMKFIEEESANGAPADANVFGRPLGQLVADEVNLKTGAMPEETRIKLRKSVGKMVNDGKYRVFCIVY